MPLSARRAGRTPFSFLIITNISLSCTPSLTLTPLHLLSWSHVWKTLWARKLAALRGELCAQLCRDPRLLLLLPAGATCGPDRGLRSLLRAPPLRGPFGVGAPWCLWGKGAEQAEGFLITVHCPVGSLELAPSPLLHFPVDAAGLTHQVPLEQWAPTEEENPCVLFPSCSCCSRAPFSPAREWAGSMDQLTDPSQGIWLHGRCLRVAFAGLTAALFSTLSFTSTPTAVCFTCWGYCPCQGHIPSLTCLHRFIPSHLFSSGHEGLPLCSKQSFLFCAIVLVIALNP